MFYWPQIRAIDTTKDRDAKELTLLQGTSSQCSVCTLLRFIVLMKSYLNLVSSVSFGEILRESNYTVITKI